MSRRARMMTNNNRLRRAMMVGKAVMHSKVTTLKEPLLRRQQLKERELKEGCNSAVNKVWV
jgi:hypothetical protein